MANTSTGKASVSLRTSVSVDSVNGDLYEFGDAAAPLVQNTGVFKQGGLTNLNETEVLFGSPADHGYTDSGELITATAGANHSLAVTVDGKSIATVSSLGVAKNLEITGYDDALLTADGTYITLKLTSNIVTVTEFSLAQVQLNTKSTTFTGIASLLALISSIGFVRYQTVHYSDVLEFSLRLGDQVVILNEGTPGQSIVTSLASTTVLGTGNAIRCCLILNNILIVAGDNGRVGSFDGTSWRNYDGTSPGIGPYNDGTAMGSNRINAIAAYGTGFAVGGVGGRVASWDGTAWKNYDGTGNGAGPSDNGTVIGSNTINAMAVWREALAIGGVGGRLGSIVSTTVYAYTTSKTAVLPGHNYPPPLANADVISTNDIDAMAIYTSGTESVLVVAGAGGLLASFDGGWVNSSGTLAPTTPATTWAFSTTTAPGGNWQRVVYGNGLWIATMNVATGSNDIATSQDGVTWTFRSTGIATGWKGAGFGNGTFVLMGGTSTTIGIATSTNGTTWTSRSSGAPGGTGWIDVAYGGGIFVAIAGTTSTTAGIATSPDGITWTFRTTAAPGGSGWNAVAFGNSLWVAVALTTSTSAAIATSSTGTTWTFTTTPATAANWAYVAFGNSVWVATLATTSTTAGIATSSNGTTWAFTTTTAPGGSWLKVSFGSGIFVAVAGTTSTTAGIATSTNGTAWTFRTTTAPASNWNWVYPGGDGPGRFCVIAAGTSTTAAIALSLPSTPVAISNNATAVSTDAITSMLTDTSLIVIGSALGKIASYNGTTWNNYNSGSGFSNNAVAVGANQVNAITKFGTTYVFGAALGKLASWDGANWKNADGTGTGTGVSNNGTVVGTTDITALAVLGSFLWIGSAGGAEVPMSSTGSFVPLYTTSTGGVVANLLAGMTGVGYLYIYRYVNGQYLVDLVGNNLNIIWTLNNSTLLITQINGQYAWPQVSGGFTRHIITGTPTVSAADVQAISLTGYTAFTSTFVPGQTYTASGISVASISQGQVGFNYADAILVPTSQPTQRVNFYAPPPTTSPTAIQRTSRGNTTNLINGYGKLTNAYGLATSAGFEFRIGWIAAGENTGAQSYLSAAIVDSQPSDAMGTVLTVVGEFDGTYTPVVGNSETTILYGAGLGAVFRIIQISDSVPNRIQRLNGRFSKINTLSPLNLYDSDTQALLVSSMDYNGRVFWNYQGAPSGTLTPTVSLIQYPGDVQFPYSASIDTGERLVSIPSPGPTSILPFGYRIPSTSQIFPGFHVDTYVSGDYSFSTFNNGTTGILPDPDFPIYAPVALLPIPIGSRYGEGTATTFGETLFLQPNFDGYLVGNSAANNASVSAVGEFVTFLLYGQIYLFDGIQIYLATITDNILVSISAMTYAQGMQFLATSPTEAFFLSNWDNSVYSYDGGRALTKVKAFTNTPAILSAKYSTYDNALLMDTTSKFIWFRDGIISVNPKKTAQLGAMDLWSTANGLYSVNASGSWRYSFYASSSSTIVQLDVQTPYLGQGKNEVSIYKGWVFKIYIPNRLGISVLVTEHTKDQAKEYTNKQTFMVPTNDIDSDGYYYLRIQPKYQRALQQSFELAFTTNIVILECDMIYDDAVGAIPASTK